jgi:PAS domain-containing protein
MSSTLKTREELQAELERLQARLVELERTEAESRQAAAVLRESEERLQDQLRELSLVYQSSPVGLYVLDRNLRFLRINQQMAEIDGISVEEHLGRTVPEVVPDLAEHLQKLWRAVFEKGEPVLDVE